MINSSLRLNLNVPQIVAIAVLPTSQGCTSSMVRVHVCINSSMVYREPETADDDRL